MRDAKSPTVGMIGLGKMGLNMAKRLKAGGHRVIGYNASDRPYKEAVAAGIEVTKSAQELIDKLSPPRIVWIMVPAGEPVDDVISQVENGLFSGDIVVDGGNSYYKDSIRRYHQLKERDIHFLDAGVSGGIWGLKVGYCLMVGGDEKAFNDAEAIFKTLAPENGYVHTGKPGSGHFVKMVHNGIEYAMMEAYAEGFEILKSSPFRLDLAAIARDWNHGSVIRSWLLELAQRALERDAELSEIAPYVADSGEGRWTAKEAIDLAVPVPAITLALAARFRSRQDSSFANKLLAALRQEFGGHAIKKA